MVNAILGSLAGVILVIGYFPQLKTLYKSSSIKGVSLLFWFLVSMSVKITLYNLLIHDSVWYVSIPQLLNALIAVIILVWVAYKKKGFLFSLLTLFVYIITAYLFTVFNSDFSQHVATAFIVMAYIIQIVYLLKLKTSEGVNPFLFIFIGLALLIMAINIYTMTNYPLAASTEIANMILVITIVFIVYKYKKK